MTRAIRIFAGLFAACLVGGCDAGSKGLGFTGDATYSIGIEAPSGFIQAGDEMTLLLRLRRVDGMTFPVSGEEVVVTASSHGKAEEISELVEVDEGSEVVFVRQVVYTAVFSGIGTVRAVFRDATATLKIPIAEGSL